MNGNEFLKKVKKYAKDNGLEFAFITHRGKGSHGTLYVGDKFTVVTDLKREIKTGLYHGMLKDLNIPKL